MKVGRDLISRVTDAVMDDARAWRRRPLEDVYPVVFLDALVLKIREGGSVQRRACMRLDQPDDRVRVARRLDRDLILRAEALGKDPKLVIA